MPGAALGSRAYYAPGMAVWALLPDSLGAWLEAIVVAAPREQAGVWAVSTVAAFAAAANRKPERHHLLDWRRLQPRYPQISRACGMQPCAALGPLYRVVPVAAAGGGSTRSRRSGRRRWRRGWRLHPWPSPAPRRRYLGL